MYQCLTGRPPFGGEDTLAIAYQHVHKAPVSLREVDPTIPEAWNELVLKALAKAPADRYQSAAQLEDAISPLLASPEESAAPVPTTVDKSAGCTNLYARVSKGPFQAVVYTKSGH